VGGRGGGALENKEEDLQKEEKKRTRQDKNTVVVMDKGNLKQNIIRAGPSLKFFAVLRSQFRTKKFQTYVDQFSGSGSGKKMLIRICQNDADLHSSINEGKEKEVKRTSSEQRSKKR
jgi:hypothetical protein